MNKPLVKQTDIARELKGKVSLNTINRYKNGLTISDTYKELIDNAEQKLLGVELKRKAEDDAN